jgi:selenocysteine lyase/cysteine desulfurase
MISCKRTEFFLPENLHYLNCAFMAPMSRTVEEAGIAGIRLKRDPSLLSSDDFFTASDQLRDSFSRLIGVSDTRRISIAPSVSYGIAAAARNMPLERNTDLVLVHEQFPSHVYSWNRLAHDRGVNLNMVRPPEDRRPRAAIWNERILEAITERCSAVCVPTVHWTDGTRFDLESISARARDVGAYVIIDATQSLGAAPFDLDTVKPDLLVTAGYKWLLGPYSLALAYWSERFDDGVPLEENWIVRRGSEDFAGLVDYETRYQEGAIRFDVGERSNFILVPMMIAALKLVNSWDPAKIQSYTRELSADVLRTVQDRGYLLEDEEWRSAHLFGIRVPEDRSLDSLKEALKRHRISASVRGNAIRVAVNVFNDQSDMDALVDALTS